MNQQQIKLYAKNFPITSILLVINIIIFLLNRFAPIQPIVSTPHTINLFGFLANFSHYDFLHFGFNMMILWQISPLIESKFKTISYAGIIAIMTVLITFGVAKLSNYPTLGFSGIGLGMMVLAGLMYWKNKNISQQLLGWAVANIAMGLLPGISFAGHFVGAVVGAIIFGVVYLVEKKKK